MKKILFISYYFPPIAGSGTQRIVKFVKYLIKFGWNVSVLTAKNKKQYEVSDDVYFKEIPGECEIIRSIDINPRGIIRFPDKKIGWVLPSFIKGLNTVRRKKIDVLFSSSPPLSAHLIALLLAIVTKKPWIVDFRDPIVNNCVSVKNAMKDFFVKWIEKKIFKYAHKIILNTNRASEDFNKRYPGNSKTVVLTNGYDESDFTGFLPDSTPKNKIIISHIGEFYEGIRDPEVFLTALSELLKEKDIKRGSIEVRLVGGRDYINSQVFLDLVNKLGLNDIISTEEHVSHEDAVKQLMRSDILLLLSAKGGELQIPAKVFEYLRSLKPILVISEKGATTDLLEGLGVNNICNYNDVNKIKDVLNSAIEQAKENKVDLSYDIDAIKQYSRKEISIRLSTIIKGILAQ